MIADLHAAARRLLARPGYLALNVSVLALGLAALLFTLALVEALLLRPLPFPQGERLVSLGHVSASSQGVGNLDSDDFLLLREHLRGVELMGAYAEITAAVSAGGMALPQRHDGAWISASLGELLGIQPLLGRRFDAADDRPGAPLVVLIGERVWREQFDGDPDILGRRIIANGEAAEIIGVLPADFGFPVKATVWLPRRMAAGDGISTQVAARLAPGIELAQLQEELDRLEEQLGDSLTGSRDGERLRAAPLAQRFVNAPTRQFVLLMLVAGGVVMLLACANAAGVQLAHSLARRRELAVRAALGAGRFALLRAALAESLLLALLASAIALLLTELGGRWLLAMLLASDGAPAYFIRFGVNLPMLGFGALAALLACLLAGLVPAWRASRSDPQGALREGERGSSTGMGRMTRGLVVAEIALTVALLAGTGVLLRDLRGLIGYELGSTADARQVLTARVGLFPQDFPDAASRLAFFEGVRERLRQDPRVIAASVGTALPGSLGDGQEAVARPGAEAPASGFPEAQVGRVDEHFLSTYGIRLLAGRDFRAGDEVGAAPVAIVDRSLADALWPQGDALGQTLLLDPRDDAQALTIVGVVETLQLEGVDEPRRPTLLLPFRQQPTRFATLAVQLRGEASDFAPTLAAAVRAEHADTPAYWLRTQEQAVAMGRVGPTLLLQIFGVVGLAALVLSAIGLYGVLAFTVAQRQRELGIRRALGAQAAALLRTVGGRLVLQVGLGMALGVLLALPWMAALQGPLQRSAGSHGVLLASAILLVLLAAIAAASLPLRRALQADPVEALRQD